MTTQLPTLTDPGPWLCWIGNCSDFSQDMIGKNRTLGEAAVEKVSVQMGTRKVVKGYTWGVRCLNVSTGVTVMVTVEATSQDVFTADDVNAFHPRKPLRTLLDAMMHKD